MPVCVCVVQEKQEENELRALPAPSPAQMKAVDAAVHEAARLYGISEEDFQERQAMVTRMEVVIKESLPGKAWGETPVEAPQKGSLYSLICITSFRRIFDPLSMAVLILNQHFHFLTLCHLEIVSCHLNIHEVKLKKNENVDI